MLKTVSSVINAIGALNYQGTWDASTNTPTLTSSVGTKGDYYVVSVAGSTNLDGTTLWGVGDWAVFNGSIWQKVDGGSTGDFTNVSISGTLTLSGGTANAVPYLNTSKIVTTGTALQFNGATLGVGVTPQTWWATRKALQVGDLAALASDSSTVAFTANIYNDASGTATYLTTAAASAYYQTGGQHLWYSAASGTAGDPITLTQRMGLDASGNLTLNAGTANGVAYLNGSKVLTTGSALTFDGTKLLASANASTTGEFKTTSSTAQVFSLVASNDAGTSIGLGVFGSAAGTFGTLTAGNPFLSTAADRMVQNVQNASGAFIWGIGSTPSEQMRLNTTGLGLGTNTPQTKVHLVGTTELRLNTTASGAVVQFWKDAAATAASSIGNAIPGGSVTNDLLFATFTPASGWLEQMRLTSTGLGIGTSSPSYKLDVNGVGRFTTRAQSAAFYGNTTGITEFMDSLGTTGMYVTGAGASPANSIRFYSVGTNTATIDSSGNLGLGVTPSAWGSPFKAFQLGVGGSLSGQTDDYTKTQMSSNAYYSSGWKYIAATSASQYAQSSGQHIWNIAAAGTAGAAISFTQAMTLDASGRLGIGTTSVSTALEVFGARQSSTIKSIINGFDTQATAADVGGGVGLGGKYDASNYAHFALVGGRKENGTSGNYAGYMVFETRPNGGELTERARIDSSGNLLVGQTSVGQPGIVSVKGSNGYGVEVTGNSGSALNADYTYGSGTGYYGYFKYGGTLVGSISSTGSSTSYNTSSDYRLKDNPQPLTNSGAFIDALQPKTWEWKADGSKGVGFIAHEVQAVSPGSVVGEKDAVDEKGNPKYQAMEYGSAEFIANIIAELQSLRKRVAQLEGA